MGVTRFFLLLLTLFSTGCVFSETGAPEFSWKKEGADAVVLLQQMIRVDTTSSPGRKEGRETELLLSVQNLLSSRGVASQMIESAPGRGNLLVRYRGGGTQKPVMIMAHVDVVNSDPSRWERDPFSGDIEDGYVWGRGAMDDKGMAAVGVQVMMVLHKLRPQLDRDVLLMLNADEESGGAYGARYVRDHYPEEVDCAFVLNEGGRVVLDGEGRISRVYLQCSEKVYNDVRLWVPGRSGHSSVPLPSNAIHQVAEFLSRIKNFQFPVRITPTMASYFRIAATLPENAIYRDLMKKIGEGDLSSANRLAVLRPDYNALMRTTFVPTKITGGIRVNVLPPTAEVNFNIRLLPGETLSQVLSQLAAKGGWGEIPVCTAEEFSRRSPSFWKGPLFIVDTEEVAAPDSPWDHPVVHTLKKFVTKGSPDAVVVPVMLPGATDSRFFRERGVPSYGIHPCPSSMAEIRTIHNHNERIRVSSVEWGVRWLYDLIVELTCKKK